MPLKYLGLSLCLILLGNALVTQPTSASANQAKVIDVSIDRQIFSVTISSPDTGCDRYADWWEVTTPDGELLYRRVLLHSHVNEQPFTRSGGPVNIADTLPVIVRVHMYPDGYSPHAFSGTIDSGFTSTTLETDFALPLATQPPLPTSCAF